MTQFVKIKKIEKIQQKLKVYNIAVEDNENYFAEGVLMHNCFSYFQKQNNPSIMRSKTGMDLKAVNVERLINIFEGKFPDNVYYKNFIKDRKVMHIGGMADNFCNFERKNKKGVKLIEYLLRTGYPIIISTKGYFMDMPEYKEMFEKYKDVANCAIQASIITSDNVTASKIEIGVPSPTKRFEQLKMLHDLGYYVILRLRPFIVGISDKTLTETLNNMNKYEIDAISTEFYCMDFRVNEEVKKRYKWMSDICGFDIVKYYKKLSPTTRGTYYRLNRNVKEQYIKQMYKFCVEHNKHFACSDPDFKELNMSASCCGLPDTFPGLFKNQMTNVLRTAFTKYHKEGKDEVKYEDVFFDFGEESGWKVAGGLVNDDISTFSVPNNKVRYMNYKMLFDRRWNCPDNTNGAYRYFDGKLKPIRKDANGNLVYKYIEHGYEKQWKKEGLL